MCAAAMNPLSDIFAAYYMTTKKPIGKRVLDYLAEFQRKRARRTVTVSLHFTRVDMNTVFAILRHRLKRNIILIISGARSGRPYLKANNATTLIRWADAPGARCVHKAAMTKCDTGGSGALLYEASQAGLFGHFYWKG